MASDARASYPPLFKIYVLGLAAACAVVVPAGIRAVAANPGGAIFWTLLIVVTHLATVPIWRAEDIDASVGTVGVVGAALVLPPSMALVVTFLGFTNWRELRREAPALMIVFNRAQTGLGAGLASFVAQPIIGSGQYWRLALATVVVAVSYDVANSSFVALVPWLKDRVPLRRSVSVVTSPFAHFALNYSIVSLLALLLVLLYDGVGAWAVGLLALPIWLGYSAQRSAREAEDRAEELAARVRELEVLNAVSSDLVGVRDSEHVRNIAEGALARLLGSAAAGEATDARGSEQRVQLSFNGHVDPNLKVVEVRGEEPAAIGVPTDIDGRALAVVEATAALVGLALTRLQVERDLAETEKARARLAGQILEEGIHERSRIALSMHDNVLPLFAAAQMQVENAGAALEHEKLQQAGDLATASAKALSEGIAALRDTLEELREKIIVPGGLRDGLHAMVNEFRSNTGIDAQLSISEVEPTVPFAVEILALETVRGCLANVERHADASAVNVALGMTQGRLSVDVSDDGRGFDPGQVGDRSHGLALMTQRAELARGYLHVDGAPGRGTSVRLEVPL